MRLSSGDQARGLVATAWRGVGDLRLSFMRVPSSWNRRKLAGTGGRWRRHSLKRVHHRGVTNAVIAAPLDHAQNRARSTNGLAVSVSASFPPALLYTKPRSVSSMSCRGSHHVT